MPGVSDQIGKLFAHNKPVEGRVAGALMEVEANNGVGTVYTQFAANAVQATYCKERTMSVSNDPVELRASFTYSANGPSSWATFGAGTAQRYHKRCGAQCRSRRWAARNQSSASSQISPEVGP